MSADIECPYCNKLQKIIYDDGFGCSEDEVYHDECENCGKNFVFTTGIIFTHSSSKADCLNGEEHRYRPTCTNPKEYTKMRCADCGETRTCTEEEMRQVLGE